MKKGKGQERVNRKRRRRRRVGMRQWGMRWSKKGEGQ
jgi:hypothetical protein